jgi:hypothetical protein
MPGFAIGNQSADVPQPSAVVESRRRHRWRFLTLSPPVKDILIHAFKADRPKSVIDKVIIHHMQDEIYVPGKNRWEPIDITFYEVENPDVAKKLTEWNNRVINFLNATIQTDYRTNARLQMVGGSGLETWTAQLFNCWPMKVTPETLDYSASEISTIVTTMSYDKAQLPGMT